MKYVCVFLSGMLFGGLVVMLITLTILDNRMDNLQSPLEGIGWQIEFLSSDIEALRKPMKDYYIAAGNALVIMDACIEIGRAEVNDYAKAFLEMKGE